MFKITDFLKNKFFLFVTFAAILCTYAFLFMFAYITKFFTVFELLDNFGFILPFAVPLSATTVFMDKFQRYGALRTIGNIWLYFMSLLVLTLPFFVMEIVINSGIFVKVILSEYFMLMLQTAIYAAISTLVFVLCKGVALRTILTFVAVLSFYIFTFEITHPFYRGSFDGFNAFCLLLALFTVSSIAYIADNKLYSLPQKIMQFVVTMVIVVSLHLIVSPFKNYIFMDIAPVPTFILTDEAKNALATLPNKVTLSVSLPKRVLEEHNEYANYVKILNSFLYDIKRQNHNLITIEDKTGYFTDGDFSLDISSPATAITEKIILPDNSPKKGLFEQHLVESVQKVSGVKRKVIGLASSLPMDGLGNDVPRWAIMNLVREYYDILPIPFNADKIPDEVDALMIVNPKVGSDAEATKFTAAFDDFMKRKGKAVVFADIYAEAENAYPQHKVTGENFADKLLSPFGLSVKEKTLAVNRQNPMYVTIPDGQNNVKKVPFIARFAVNKDDFNHNTDVLKDINKINITSSGVLDFSKQENLPLNFTSLATSVYEKLDDNVFNNLNSPSVLMNSILMRDSRNNTEKDNNPENYDCRYYNTCGYQAPVMAEISGEYGKQNIMLFVIADSDMLYNQFWKDIRGNDAADNGIFVMNILDVLTGRPSFSYKEQNGGFLSGRTWRKGIGTDFQTSMILWVAAAALSILMCIFFLFMLNTQKVKE